MASVAVLLDLSVVSDKPNTIGTEQQEVLQACTVKKDCTLNLTHLVLDTSCHGYCILIINEKLKLNSY